MEMEGSKRQELPLICQLKAIGNKNDGRIVIATHDDSFHADEILAIAVLMEALPSYHFSVIRTRNREQIANADIAVDVGGGRFDHHDARVRYPNGVPMAACGKILAATEPDTQLITMLCRDLFYAVEATDNGEPCSSIRGIGFNKLDWVSSFNPNWDERKLTDGEYMTRFYEVLDMVRKVYRRVRRSCLSRIKARTGVLKAPIHMGGRFIELPPGGMPWQYHAVNNPLLLGAIYPNVSNTQWVVRVAKDDPTINSNRVEFPFEWGGKEDTEFERLSHIPGSVFCHKSCHLAIFRTKDAALHACRILSERYRLDHGGGVI